MARTDLLGEVGKACLVGIDAEWKALGIARTRSALGIGNLLSLLPLGLWAC